MKAEQIRQRAVEIITGQIIAALDIKADKRKGTLRIDFTGLPEFIEINEPGLCGWVSDDDPPLVSMTDILAKAMPEISKYISGARNDAVKCRRCDKMFDCDSGKEIELGDRWPE